MGFEFAGQHSDDFGLYFRTSSIPYMAPKRSMSMEVQGRDGNYVFEDGYNNIIITIACVIIGARVLDRRKQARAIAEWLSNTGILVFDTESDINYNVVKITNDVSANMLKSTDSFNISFECEPYQTNTYYNDSVTWGEATSTWGNMEIPWGGYDRSFDVKASDTIEVVNAGTYKALPIIKLSGSATTITIGGFTITNISDDVYVDCKDQVVYTLSGSTKVNKIADFTGDFPELAPGTNSFDISGTITSMNIEYDYKNTYL